jgi:hypothetical protein
MLAVSLCIGELHGDGRVPEYHVKAAFLYKFATYVEWPAASDNGLTQFTIGIIGHDPFGRRLDAVVEGQRIRGKAIVVRRLSGLEEIAHCQVLFVSASERPHLQAILGALRGAPVLTVGDMNQFAESGGMINLVTDDDDHIRFDINKKAIDRAGLKALTQLLRLARIVDSGPRPVKEDR